MTPAIELAVQALAGWSGPVGGWYHCDGEVLGHAEHPEYTNSTTHMAIVKRGGVVEQAGANVTETRTRRFHRWSRVNGIAFVPSSRTAADAALALSWMKSPVHADLLLVYAQEDTDRWSGVRLVLSVHYRIPAVIFDHAMAKVMRPAKRRAISAAALAFQLGMRKDRYLKERGRAGGLLLDHLDRAADRFLAALWSRNRKFPANDLLLEGDRKVAA
jgi:hypothetical protein